MERNLVILFIPFLFLFIGMEIIYSWVRNLKLYRLSDSLNNLAAGISNQIFIIVFHSITIAGYLWIYFNWRIFDLPVWPNEFVWKASSLSLFGIAILTWVACLFFYELAYYWNHRLSHEMNFLWAGHIVHHQSEEYNLSVAFRQASFRGLFTWVFYLPLAILGFPPAVMGLVAQFSLIYQFLIHIKWIRKFPKWYEMIFNSPSHHRVHHGRNQKYINKNYGGMFIFFDKWFGTFEPEIEEPVYGITTQLKSFNPLWANFHYWKEMIDLAKKSSGWKNRMKVFFASPGWKPSTFVDPEKKSGKDSVTFRKYDVILPKGLAAYSIFWSCLTLTGSFWVLATVSQFPNAVLQTIFFISIFSFVCIGGICDLKKWVLYLEPIRLLYLSYIAFPFFETSSFSFSVFGASISSWVWLWFYRDFFGNRKENFTF
ncbi:sterol desaturase family protein [Leptospira sp. 201903070]|uniref:Sterol desaturase family protein n=1 Tax=Leptospira ainlahdjerensis TaxID=2810033 RepID=A0ABS2UCM2_9LEPT|nr:sterol desaturase family protein [Leptospira ainlahdjerensis]MBM9578126.1 sterol desaturase family protein [Leptospira ainlahdjerensis]